MSDLSQDLEELVVAGRGASRPTVADFDRVLGGLRGRLGAIGATGTMAAAARTGQGARWLSGKTIAIAAAGIALMMSGIALWSVDATESTRVESGSEPQRGSSTVPAMRVIVSGAPARDPANSPRPPEPPIVSPNASQSKSPATNSSVREPPRNRDSLAEEVAILSRAETELHGGRAENALRALSEHERKFPNGILTEERIAARVQALCALGRNAEASTQLTRLRSGSLHSETARRACTASSGVGKASATGQPSASSTNKH